MPNPYIDIPDDDELSREQLEVYNYKLDSNLIINGAAGSGKTILAILRAKQLSEKGKSVLFIVYNNVLKAFTELAMKEFGLKNVRLAMPTDLAEETLGQRRYDLNDNDRNRLCNAYNYDHVIVDEGQDFWMKDFKMFSYFGKVHTICCDRKQGIYDTDFDPDELGGLKVKDKLLYPDIEQKILAFTYRNPEKIVKLSLNYFWQKYNTIPTERQDIKFYGKTIGNCNLIHTNNEIDTMAQLIKNKGENAIGIIVPRGEGAKYISESLEARGIQVQKRYKIYVNAQNGQRRRRIVDDIDFNITTTKVVTFWSCKGIQFDSVIIPFMDGATSPKFAEYSNQSGEGKAMYVAMTRPKEKLYFIQPQEYSFPYKEYLDPNLYEEVQRDQKNINPDDTYKF